MHVVTYIYIIIIIYTLVFILYSYEQSTIIIIVPIYSNSLNGLYIVFVLIIRCKIGYNFGLAF